LDCWQKALPKADSLQQAIRLKLTIADALIAADKPAEALDMLDGFLKSYPDFSNRKGVLAKAVPLAEKTGRKEAEAAYRAEMEKLQPPAPKKDGDQAAAEPDDKKPFFQIRMTGR
jgi:hypothetical protein